jgi:aminopeptidase N
MKLAGSRAILRGLGVLALFSLIGTVGCASGPRIGMRAERYRLEVALDPPEHRIVGRASLDLTRATHDDLTGLKPAPHSEAESGPVTVAFQLHPDLRVTRVHAGGARVLRHWPEPERMAPGHPSKSADAASSPATYVVKLDRPVEAMTLFVEYEGRLVQDVAAGERPGQIHNFAMRAHIGDDGVYLADGYWYPEPVAPEEAEPRLADYSLVARRVAGMELVAGAERDHRLAVQTGQLAWRSPYPMNGIVLTGGPNEVHHTMHRGIALTAHLKPDQAKFAGDLLDAARRYLDRYQALLGPYPAHEYKIVSNFFSSGFAFPTMTLLSPAVIGMGSRAYDTHGYLDHEMVHSWWGNGVFVDPGDGNWCESLTSFATNYYGFVLDGNDEEARRKRRNYAHFLSRMDAEKDRPLGTYGQPDGCSRNVAYNKGAAVFNMLANQVGEDRFFAALRVFNQEYLGRYASWDDIRRVCERETGANLERFFEDWVRRAGAPLLRIESARYDSADGILYVQIVQDDPPFEVDVPLRLAGPTGVEDIVVEVDAVRQELTIPVLQRPMTVELDPDHQVFRRVPLDDIVPTTAATRYGHAFTSVLPAGDVPDVYRRLETIFWSSFEEGERVNKVVGDLNEGDLADRCVLIVGEAVRDPYVSGFLQALEFPVRWTDDGFELSGIEYSDPADAVLCTVRHPGVIGGGVTVVYGNSVEAIPSPFAVPMYEHGLVIFEQGRPTVRLDFEERRVVTVEPR